MPNVRLIMSNFRTWMWIIYVKIVNLLGTGRRTGGSMSKGMIGMLVIRGLRV